MRKVTAIILMLIIAMGVSAPVAVPYYLSDRAYKQAVGYLDAGDLELALEKFVQAGDFKNAVSRADEIRDKAVPYNAAMENLNQGRFEEAEKGFSVILDYKDSAENIILARDSKTYQEAVKAMDAMSYLEAHDLFSSLEGFSDSRELAARADEAVWNHALSQGASEYYRAYLGMEDPIHEDEAGEKLTEAVDQEGYFYAAKEYEAAINSGDIELVSAYIKKWEAADPKYSEPYMEIIKAESSRLDVLLRQDRLEEQARAEYMLAYEAGTGAALLDFMYKWEEEKQAEGILLEAGARIEELRTDESLSQAILGDPDGASDADIAKFLADFPSHVNEKAVRSIIGGSILDLIQIGSVSAVITGIGIDFTNVSVTNNTNRSLTVEIPLGVYFASSDSGVQNMAVRRPAEFIIGPGAEGTVRAATACMDIRRDIPAEKDSFTAADLRNDDNERLFRVLTLLNEEEASFAVAQAAVWIVTDNPSDYNLLNTLKFSDGSGAISEDDLEHARNIVGRTE